MSPSSFYRWGILPLWLLLTTTLFFRNPIPIDETRYLSVAWEMWLRGDFLVPYLNGHPYSHKPPLLFWLFEAGWKLFGVNEWWPRLIGPFGALGNLLLIRYLALKLWPEDGMTALKAPWVLMATLLWTLFATSTMFDILLTCCVLLGMIGLVEASNDAIAKGWTYFALAIGTGLLVKGPVIFLHLLPTAILVFLWHRPRHNKRWFVYLTIATLAGCAIALAWAIPAAAAGGKEYASAILWHQTADRTVGTKIHVRAFYWYLPFLPMLLFPWIALPRFWGNLRATSLINDTGLRFCLVWLLLTLTAFSMLPSKQIHYLIPCLPAFALLCARLLTRGDYRPQLARELIPALLITLIGAFLAILPLVPGLAMLSWVQQVQPYWGLSVLALGLVTGLLTCHFRRQSISLLSTTVVISTFFGFIFFFEYTGLQYNLRPAALKVSEFNDNQIPIAFVGDYQGQLHFLGRLTQPLTVIAKQETQEWARRHPHGFLISLEKTRPEQAYYTQPHREYWLIFRSSEQALL